MSDKKSESVLEQESTDDQEQVREPILEQQPAEENEEIQKPRKMLGQNQVQQPVEIETRIPRNGDFPALKLTSMKLTALDIKSVADTLRKNKVRESNLFYQLMIEI